MRFRIFFKKNTAMRFTGHLDLQHTWMRVFRRAGITLEYSQGFHPLPKVQLASALPLGYIGENEALDIWTRDNHDLTELAMRISAVLPPGLQINQLQEIPQSDPKVQVALKSADYIVMLPMEFAVLELGQRIQDLLASTNIPIDRRGKERNLREWVETIELGQSPENQPILCMRLSARESATGRPDEVLTTLGIDPYTTLIKRTSLIF